MKVLVIGGGIFGCSVASELAFANFKVTLTEKEQDIMLNASWVNHNRLHLGYHYLRSKATAQQSLDGPLLTYRAMFERDLQNGVQPGTQV